MNSSTTTQIQTHCPGCKCFCPTCGQRVVGGQQVQPLGQGNSPLDDFWRKAGGAGGITWTSK